MTEAKHKGIFAAIAAAVGDVKQLGKSDRNKFDGYDFVSIDKFLALVNPICAKHEIFPSINLSGVEFYENTNSKGGKATWARFTYAISLHHSSGETFGPQTMMVAVPMNGAQASGSAQSYALKQFFRGMFMIPTGDKDDPDLNATEQHHEVRDNNAMGEALKDAWRQSVEDALPENASPRQRAEAYATAICEDFDGKGEKALKNRWDKHKSIIAQFEARFPDLHEKVVDAFENRMIELGDNKGD